MGTEVAIQILHGDVSVDKQTRECLRFAAQEGWHVKTMSPSASVDQTVRLVEQGHVGIVVMPFVSAESLQLEARIADAGGRVAYCRQPPERGERDPDTPAVIRARRRASGPGTIARDPVVATTALFSCPSSC